MDYIETTHMFFNVCHNTNSSDVVTCGDKADVTSFEFNEVFDLIGFKVKFSGIISFNFRVGESESSSIVRYDIGNLVGAHSSCSNFNQFEFSFFRFNGFKNESTLSVVENSEVF